MKKMVQMHLRDQKQVVQILESYAGADYLVQFGKRINFEDMSGFLLYNEDILLGLALYRIEETSLEILAVISLQENKGNGNLLLRTLLNKGIDEGVTRIFLTLSNDNTRGLRFYQRMGFSLVKLHKQAISKARKKHPHLPLYADFIKVEHVLELEQRFE